MHPGLDATPIAGVRVLLHFPPELIDCVLISVPVVFVVTVVVTIELEVSCATTAEYVLKPCSMYSVQQF